MDKKQHFKRLQNTLMIAFLALSITPLTLIALFFLQSHSQDLAEQSTAHLDSLRDSKEQQILSYIEARESEVLSFARSELANASGGRFYGLVSAFQQLGKTPEQARENAQTRYINNSGDQLKISVTPDSNEYAGSERYRLLHKRYHWAYLELLKRSDFTDILLIDVDGNVVYSTTKDDHYGTNLISGKFRDSSLGKTFTTLVGETQKQRNTEQFPILFSDFSQQEDENIAWFASPIIQQGYLHSYVMFKLPNTGLTQQLQDKLDESSNISTLLVGKDLASRISSTSEQEINQNLDIIKKTLSGFTEVGQFTNNENQPILAAFSPVNIHDKSWALVIELPESEAFARIHQLEKIFILSMLVAIVCVVIASHYLSNSITAPLLRLTWAAERVSAGDLDQEISSTDRKDEIGRLAVSFARMQRSIRDKIQLIKTQNTELENNLNLITQQNDDLQIADKLKDEFLATTSHELRTPLHGMVGIAEALLSGSNGPIPAHQRHQLEIIINSGHRLATLVDDLLDYHKMRYGSLDINHQTVDLSAATSLVLELSNHLLGSKPIRIINQVPATLPLVVADEQRLEQVLYNLIGNAIKYTSEGKIVISATVLDEQLRVQVVDTGHGIPAEQLEHIFEPLIQAGQDSNRYRQGAGLGLSISRQLIELMGGNLYVSSQPMVGATFSFTLPLASEQDLATTQMNRAPTHFQAPTRTEAALELTEALPDNPEGPLLIVADDEPVNLQILESFLRLEGYRVKTADDGPKTLKLLIEEKPELLLLDVMMPGMSGYEVCQKLREEFDHAQLPIIMLTALSQTQDRVRGFDAGANDYLTKPFNKEELAARISAHLQASKAEIRRKENTLLQQELRNREQVEASLLETQGRLLEQLESASEPILCAKHDGRVRFANNAAAKLFKLTPEQLNRHTLDEVVAKKSLLNVEDHFSGHIDVYIQNRIETVSADILRLPEQSGLQFMVIFSTSGEGSGYRVANLENAVEALSSYAFDGDKAKLQQLRELGGEFTRLADKVENKGGDKNDLMREILVEVMILTIDYWEEATGHNKFTLAEESGLWRVYLDRSTLQTRTLDKYLRTETLPKTPRWRTVLNTIDYVLEHCSTRTDSRQKIESLREQLQKLITN